MTERFQPGGVTHALVSGLVELAWRPCWPAPWRCRVEPGAASLSVASLLWAVLAVVSLLVAWLRARVLAAELDDEAVTLHGLGGPAATATTSCRPSRCPAAGPGWWPATAGSGRSGGSAARPGQPLPGPGPGPRQGRRRDGG